MNAAYYKQDGTETIETNERAGMDREGLADFLRRRREALRPSDVGLSAGMRRRTPGLRREEVAQLASMSPDFYARLEQQRGARPSEDMLAAIAGALRFTADERDHLFVLAGHTPPPRAMNAMRAEQPSPQLQRMLDQLTTPALIFSELGVILRQNALAVALVGVQTEYIGWRRSLIYRWFTDPAERRIIPDEDHALHARTHVASLRAVYRRDGHDRNAEALVRRLMQESEEFAQLWSQHEVASFTGSAKRFFHSQVGIITLTCDILTAANETQELHVLTARPGSVDAARLARLERLARVTTLFPQDLARAEPG